MDNRPRSREKNVTNDSKGIKKRGEGLSGNSQKPSGSSGGGINRKAAGGAGAILVAIIAIVMNMLGGGGGGSQDTTEDLTAYDPNNPQAVAEGDPNLNYEDHYIGNIVTNNYPDATSNAGQLDSSVANGTRAKYTTIKGNGQDQITIMIYMCGTDLESKYGMATKDLKEMTRATLNSHINIIVYTGGCNNWKNSLFSNKTNQIWKITNGSLECLVNDDGNKSMTDPATLTAFIKYCDKNYPANRRELIMWDHGGGSITGYGYDEKKGHSGSMTLEKLDQALKNANVKFDFIGFDACLMATLESGLTMEAYADYYIGSEETEPGVGWYYTNWLTALAKNPSMPTVEIGKNIIDSYVTECNRTCNGQKTCLSIVDLAELKKTVPDKLNTFASSMNTLIANDNYKKISDARYKTREFAQSSAIDHVDLVHLAKNMGTSEGKDLANAVLSCVKYNRTSSNMKDAYGVSIYFPYRKVNKVDSAVSAYKKLGMDSEYTKCIRSFAQVEVSGQSASNGTSNPLGSLLGGGGSNTVNTLLDLLINREIPEEDVEEYVSANTFDTSYLNWQEMNGKKVIAMPEEQWSMVHDITINMFYDDGEGYIDLGNDNLFEFDADGNMIADEEHTWIAIDGQPVAYQYMDTTEDGGRYSIMGYVPAFVNGDRMDIILIFDTDHPEGYIAGAREVYEGADEKPIAKAEVLLHEGDKVDFICEYYDYNGNYLDSYYLGEQMTLTAAPVISNVPVEGDVLVTYRFTDIYNQTYWTPVIK